MFIFSLRNYCPLLCRIAMVTYEVTVHTGTRPLAGTTSFIYIQLRGTEAESEENNLNQAYFSLGFSAGSVSYLILSVNCDVK